MSTPAFGQKFKGSRGEASTLYGSIGEMWDGETQLGVFYKWRIHGSNGEWEGDAQRVTFMNGVKLDPLVGRELKLRFFITKQSRGGETLLEFDARGKCNKPNASQSSAVIGFKGTVLTVV